ncbi:uncharacterized protein LOC111251478 isoform X2 [Varroa destructor]|uniref:Uncharacterized protein n=1 Tax=Varroa destructor TaxID=109461 RepID=A0A7M7MHQ5_VARDE|nr:uncharacterized protein LOC111251478 isoform X2 [Varroa destructor]
MDTFPIRRVRGRSFGIYRLERRIFSLRYRLRHRFSGAMQLKCCQGGAQPISMVRFVGVQRHQGKPSTSLVRVTYHTIVHTLLQFLLPFLNYAYNPIVLYKVSMDRSAVNCIDATYSSKGHFRIRADGQ